VDDALITNISLFHTISHKAAAHASSQLQEYALWWVVSCLLQMIFDHFTSHLFQDTFVPRITKRIQQRRLTRRKSLLLMVGCVLSVLSSEDLKGLRGRFLGSKNIKRTRKEVDKIFDELGCYQRKAYRMSRESFQKLHDDLPEYEKIFPNKRKRGKDPNGAIPTALYLSAAIRYFAGGSPLDIMLSHGLARSSVYNSVWGTVNAVNKTKSMSFNEDEASFPSHKEQEDIAKGFESMSGAGFDKVSLAVDGLLVWTKD
jgi:hypothetical protein